MASKVCSDIANILNRYWHPLTTQKHIDAFCEEHGITPDDITGKHAHHFLLYFAKLTMGGTRENLKKYQKTVADITIYINKKWSDL